MHRSILTEQIKQKGTYLCVGLDTDLTKIPKHLQKHPNAVVEFNKAIIDATIDHCVGYKIDIGNTSSRYAKAFFETIPFDAITVAPYMGEDSIRPFLEYENKWTIVLGLTSNLGARDFEMLKLINDSVNNITEEETTSLRNEFLYENVLKKVASWGTLNNLMFVVGATQATEFTNIRNIIPQHFLLVPGIGFQGGSLKEISLNAMNQDCGILVNASRAIIYAGLDENFAAEAKAIATQYHTEMKLYLKK